MTNFPINSNSPENIFFNSSLCATIWLIRFSISNSNNNLPNIFHHKKGKYVFSIIFCSNVCIGSKLGYKLGFLILIPRNLHDAKLMIDKRVFLDNFYQIWNGCVLCRCHPPMLSILIMILMFTRNDMCINVTHQNHHIIIFETWDFCLLALDLLLLFVCWTIHKQTNIHFINFFLAKSDDDDFDNKSIDQVDIFSLNEWNWNKIRLIGSFFWSFWR